MKARRHKSRQYSEVNAQHRVWDRGSKDPESEPEPESECRMNSSADYYSRGHPRFPSTGPSNASASAASFVISYYRWPIKRSLTFSLAALLGVYAEKELEVAGGSKDVPGPRRTALIYEQTYITGHRQEHGAPRRSTLIADRKATLSPRTDYNPVCGRMTDKRRTQGE